MTEAKVSVKLGKRALCNGGLSFWCHRKMASLGSHVTFLEAISYLESLEEATAKVASFRSAFPERHIALSIYSRALLKFNYLSLHEAYRRLRLEMAAPVLTVTQAVTDDLTAILGVSPQLKLKHQAEAMFGKVWP
ncbi:hypothetical protein [Variovorax sp. UMC13]|uniref:hypothetical protein n=1 Tax=Variovorax sp. UMC13 TaxID=1862326 RepID=UPI0016030B11|nr:hypothetical protein [Variovorax sp. UMC13]